MSYLILIVSFICASWAVTHALVQLSKVVYLTYNKQKLSINFTPSIALATWSFVLACLAIYVNHWPKS